MNRSTVQPKSVRGGFLDLLRFMASLFVVLFHYGDEAPRALQSLHEVWSRGYLATDFFLMLSGFVLARAYGRSLSEGRIKPLNFWLKRVARSYPTHLITLGLLILMVLAAQLVGKTPNHPEHFPMDGIVSQVLLLHVFGLGGGQWNIPAWTLSALLICYAAMPWLWQAISRLGGPLICLALASTLLLSGQMLSLPLLGVSLFELPYTHAMIRATPLFIVGLLLARTVETGDWTPQSTRLLMVSGAGLLALDVFTQGPDTLSLVAIGLLTLGCGAHQMSKPIPGAVWGAKVSFSLFMTHTLVGAVCFSALRPILEGLYPPLARGMLAWVFWFGVLAAALVTADLYNRLIDAPLQRWIRRRWFDTPPASARVQPDVQLGYRVGQGPN